MTSPVALVTGGSAGLGLHLSRVLARKKYQVAIVARHEERLNAAVAALRSEPQAEKILPIAADVTQQPDVERIFGVAQGEFGRLDLLVNCAGRSMRGLASQTSLDDFRDLLELNTLATIACCQNALPALRESHGCIINVASLASRIATPNLGAYPASKFALAAYSEQLRRELKPAGIHVLTVFPGPIARDDAGSRYTDQTEGLGNAAEMPGGSRLKATLPETLATKIVAAAERRQPELMPLKARLYCLVANCLPSLGDWIVRKYT